MVKQTAGRDALHDFAPKFAELNDDVLFGEARTGNAPLVDDPAMGMDDLAVWLGFVQLPNRNPDEVATDAYTV